MRQMRTKLIKKHLGFLETAYGMTFVLQSFDDFHGFCGPINTYSFYNEFGCFTLHHIVQRDEWSWFRSTAFHKDQYALLETEIIQTHYVKKRCFLLCSLFKTLGESIQKQICSSGSFFDIPVICPQTDEKSNQ